MATSESTLQSFESDPSIGTNLNFAYTNRTYQTSNIVTQDQRKEGILSFFENINYNERKDLVTESEPVQTNQSTSMSPGAGTSGAY